MSYELLCTAIIKRAVSDIEDYILYGDTPDGKIAYSWIKQRPNYAFSLYASATCGDIKMRELIEAQIREVRVFKRWLKEKGIKPMLCRMGSMPYRNSKKVNDARRKYKLKKLHLTIK